MGHDENNRWIIGETLETLGDDAVVWVVHTQPPRVMGILRSCQGRIDLAVQWSESPLTLQQEACLCEDVMRYFVDYNLTAYGQTGPSYSF